MSISIKTLGLVRNALNTAKADAQRQEFKPAYIIYKLNETLTGLSVITNGTSENRAHKAKALRIITDAKTHANKATTYDQLITVVDEKIRALPSAIDLMKR